MRNFGDSLTALGALWVGLGQIVSHADELYTDVRGAAADGVITGDEAADIGEAFSAKVGNIRIPVRGTDVLLGKAQRDIFRGLARALNQTVRALQAPPPSE